MGPPQGQSQGQGQGGASTFSYNHNNPAAPAGKTDFGAKGPNPIQVRRTFPSTNGSGLRSANEKASCYGKL